MAMHSVAALGAAPWAPDRVLSCAPKSPLRRAPPLPSGTAPRPRRRAAPTSAAAAAAAVPHLAATTALFAGANMYAFGAAALLAVAPRWAVTRRAAASPWAVAPLAAAYGLLLAWSWQPDTLSLILPGSWETVLSGDFSPQFFPSLLGISTLFSRVATAASLWVHILAINLFAARQIYLEGMDLGVHTGLSIVMCMVLAPLGLGAHAVVKHRVSRRTMGAEVADEIVARDAHGAASRRALSAANGSTASFAASSDKSSTLAK